MKNLVVFCTAVLLVSSCKKKPVPAPPQPHPKMRYTNLDNKPVLFGGFHRIDMDGDNTRDVIFSTLLVADPLQKVTEEQYYGGTAYHVSLLINDQEETPVFNRGDSIKIEGQRQSVWYNANSVILAQKVIGSASEHWEGNWRASEHKYLAVQIARNGLKYNGWVELSFSTVLNKIILHRAAISAQAGKTIRAGY